MTFIDLTMLGIIAIAAFFSAKYLIRIHFFSRKLKNKGCTACPCNCGTILYNVEGSSKECEST